MLLSEIAEHVIIRSGQFVLSDLQGLGFSNTKFWRLVNPVLALYESFRSPDYAKAVNTQVTLLNPKPISVTAVVPTIFPWFAAPTTTQPQQVPFTYDARTGSLSVGSLLFPCEVQGRAQFDRTVTYETNSTTQILEIDFPQLSLIHDAEFFDLLTGSFVRTLGLSRRAFTIQDIPIESDSTDMVSEGKEQYETALAELKESTNDWYMGVIG